MNILTKEIWDDVDENIADKFHDHLRLRIDDKGEDNAKTQVMNPIRFVVWWGVWEAIWNRIWSPL